MKKNPIIENKNKRKNNRKGTFFQKSVMNFLFFRAKKIKSLL